MSDNRLFKYEIQVRDYFLNAYNIAVYHKNTVFRDGILIDTKLRKEILTGENSGKITIGGRVEKYVFENLGGGVYKCRVSNVVDYE